MNGDVVVGEPLAAPVNKLSYYGKIAESQLKSLPDRYENIEIDKSIAKFILTVGEKKYDGELEINPFDGTLVADIGEIIEKTYADFFHIGKTFHALGFFPALLQGRQQHGGENGDDRYNNQ